MNGFFTNLVGEAMAPWASGLVVSLLIGLALWVLVTMFGRYRQSVFVTGGRKKRLEVVDATAVDDRRRLVLVRRDNIEHLVMIGGHNDIVIEKGIVTPETAAASVTRETKKTSAQSVAAPEKSVNAEPAPKHRKPANQQTASVAPDQSEPEPTANPTKTSVAVAAAAPTATAANSTSSPAVSAPKAASRPAPTESSRIEAAKTEEAPAAAEAFDLDEALAEIDFGELDDVVPAKADDKAHKAQADNKADAQPSLEGEMEKLLSELSVNRK
ncbi:MAG: hypothetical protein AAFY99_05155 [Pseudomonadota bacterium]